MFPKPSEKIAIISPGLELSYTGLIRRINAASQALSAQPADRVAIVSENRPEWIIAFHAIWQRQAVVVPIDPGMPPKDMALIFADCHPSVVYASQTTIDGVREALVMADLSSSVIDLARLDELPEGGDTLTLPAPVSMQSLAALPYTSGTTGQPKGVMLSYENLATSSDAVRAEGYYVPEETVMALLPFFHILPLQGAIIIPLAAGCTVAFAAGLQREDIARTLREAKITLFVGVPRLYSMFHAAISERVRASLVGRTLFALSRLIGNQGFGRRIFGKVHRALGPNVRVWISGGAKADPVMLKEMWALGFRMIEGYGLTETAPIVSFNPQDKPRLGTAGLPVQGTEVRIDDGEIIVRGKNVMQGYYNKPEATAKVLRDGWFHTGDTGEFDKKGYLVVTGRKDEMIVLANGKNIDPESIEKQILSSTGLVQEVAVLQVDGQLAAVIQPQGDCSPQGLQSAEKAIRTEVLEPYNARVPNYRRILQLRLTSDPLPRTRLGKLRRFLLKDFFTAPTPANQSTTEEISDTALAQVCSFLSRRKKLPARPDSRLDLDLGLDSLDRLEMAAYLQSELGLTIAEADLARATTVSEAVSLARAATDGEVLQANDPFDGPVEMPKLRKGARSSARALLSFFMRRLFRLRIEGLENLPEEPCIIVANHESYLDAPSLIAKFPKRFLARSVTWIKASSVMERVVKFFSRGRNLIVVHAKSDLAATLRSSAAVIEAGYNLMVFPEGLRSRDGGLASFRPGFAMIACRTGVPVVPVAIEGALEAMPYGKTFPRFGKKICLKILSPLRPEANETPEDLADCARSAIASIVEKDHARP